MKTEQQHAMTIAKARFLIRVHLERVEKEYGSTWMREIEMAIQYLINDAVANIVGKRVP